jgi:hypothetical protein
MLKTIKDPEKLEKQRKSYAIHLSRKKLRQSKKPEQFSQKIKKQRNKKKV